MTGGNGNDVFVFSSAFGADRIADFDANPGGGGLIGWIMTELVRSALGTAGTVVVLIGSIPVVVILISGLSFKELFQMIRDSYYRFQDWRHLRQLPIINQPNAARIIPPAPKTRLIDRVLPRGRPDLAKAQTIDGEGLPLVIVGTAKELPSSQAPQLPAGSPVVNTETGGKQWQLPNVSQIFNEGYEIEIIEGNSLC